MIESLSKPLFETVVRLNLCSPADLRRCRRRVRRLARDLPAFDSVWIDALLHARKLTPFQAQTLESGHPERLCVGPCLLLNPLGYGLSAKTYLARRREGRERCVLKLINCRPESFASARAGLDRLVTDLDSLGHPNIVVPHRCLLEGNKLVTVSRYIPGPHLGELLVRRGRYATSAVVEIACQLIDGLEALEKRESVHGDIRLCNVRLTNAGVAVLVDAGINRTLYPQLNIHASLPPDRYDGTAPELIGTGEPPTYASDMYALGCLLWQLLAGRPPFPTGDPLAKLASHQTRNIGDVREWAPDTPATLAEALCALTANDLTRRPASFHEVRQQLTPLRRPGRKFLAKLAAASNVGTPQSRATSAPRRMALLLTLLFICSGAALSLLDEGARNIVLRIPAVLRQSTSSWIDERFSGTAVVAAGNENTQKTREGSPLRPLPRPNAGGIIQLSESGPYATAEITQTGMLTIRGPERGTAEIVVAGRPFQIRAGWLSLENVRIRAVDPRDPNGASRNTGPKTLLHVQTKGLTLNHCVFESGTFGETTASAEHGGVSTPPPVAVAWTKIDGNDRRGSRIRLQNTLFSGVSSAILCATPPERIECSNVLFLGPGSLITLAALPVANHELRISLERLTLRSADSLLRLTLPDEQTTLGRVTILADNCVLDLTGRRAAFFQLISPSLPQTRLSFLRMSGQGSLASPGLELAVWLDPVAGTVTPLDALAVEIDGISAGPFEFRGKFGPSPSDSVIKEFQAPSHSPDPPGIEALSLPVPQSVERLHP